MYLRHVGECDKINDSSIRNEDVVGAGTINLGDLYIELTTVITRWKIWEYKREDERRKMEDDS